MGWSENRKRVQAFNEELGKLEQSHQHKVRKILENQCLEEVSPFQRYVCKPISGYNKTTHQLIFVPIQGKFTCSCQGYRTYGRCSHVDALMIVLKLKGEVLQPSLF